MKVLFVHTSISSCGFKSLGIGDEGSWINHGFCSISAYAKSRGRHIELLDMRKLSGWGEFTDEIRLRKPDVVGLNMMTVDFDYAMKCARIVKELDPKARVVVGGPHPTLATEEVAAEQNVDHIIVGEGEITFVELLGKLERGESPERVLIGVKPELDSLPFVDRDLYAVQEQPIEKCCPPPFATLIAGRGCAYNCSFCQPAEKIIFGHKVRRRSVDNVINELKILRDKYKMKSFL